MSFIYPGFLFALFALAIPIIVHLFNFRKFKKIYFTNVRFLKEIKQDTQSRSRLKHLLVLLMRLLAVAFLVLAFAQPYIPSSNRKATAGIRRVSVFLDNSFSMDAVSKNGSLLDVARKKAREIALAYSPSDQFQLLTNDFEAQHQRLLSREEFLQEIDEVHPTASVHSLSEIVIRQTEALHPSAESGSVSAASYILSDFQHSISDFELLKSDTTLQINLVPLVSALRQNVFIDTCYFSVPFIQLNVPNELVVKLRNTGEETAENIPLKLLINGVQKALTSVSISGNSAAESKLSFTISEPGWQSAQISIADYPVTFDDNYYFSLNVLPNLQVLSLNGNSPSPSLHALFASDPYFRFSDMPAVQVDYSMFRNQQLIILNEIDQFSSGLAQEIGRYVNQGGRIVVTPSPKAELGSYQSLLSAMGCSYFSGENLVAEKVDKIETGHSLFKDVFERGKSVPENMDLPVVSKSYVLTQSSRQREESLLKLQSGHTFLGFTRVGNGAVFTLAVPLEEDWSNFARHALFVPVFLKAALLGSSEIAAPLIIGRDRDILVRDTVLSGETVFHLSNPLLKFEFIPEAKRIDNSTILSVYDQVKSDGNYILKADNRITALVAFNYNRKESDLTCYTPEELGAFAEGKTGMRMSLLEQEGKDLTHTITQLNEGTRLWKYCILAVLFFLAAEILLIRLFKS